MPLRIAQGYEYKGDDWWDWWVWLEGSEHELDLVDHVVYMLHRTFPNPVRTVRSRTTKFMLKTAGWGVFNIHCKVLRKDGTVEKLNHYLELRYPDGKATTA